jgi:hypothetical protein
VIFDTAAAIAERYITPLVERLRNARLFVFPGKAHEVLPKAYSADERRTLSETFFLPFSTVAVEDTVSCTVMWDMEKGQTGLDGRRGFIEIQPFTEKSMMDAADATEEDRDYIKQSLSKYPEGTITIAEGWFGPLEMVDDKRFNLIGGVDWIAVATKDKGVLGMDAMRTAKKHDYELLSRPILINVETSLQEVFYFNLPDRFVVEEMPAAAEKRARKKTAKGRKKVPRSHERPRYTLLLPRQIRKKLGLPEPGQGGPKRPHERRRHYRTYPDDEARWPKAHGKTIVVPASWIGPSEATLGKTRYRIRLDI